MCRNPCIAPNSVICAVALTVAPSVGALSAEVPESAAPRSINAQRSLRTLTVDLPVSSRGLLAAAIKLSASSRTPVGIEVIDDFRVGPPRADPYIVEQLDLSGMDLTTALGRLVDRKVSRIGIDYEWFRDGGVVHVRPAAFRNNRTVALNRRVNGFRRTFNDAAAAVLGIQRLFDDRYRDRVPRQMSYRNERARQFFQRQITVDVTGSVRDVLDSIIVAHGAASWTAEYRASGEYAGMRIALVGYDGWTVGATARR